MHFIASVVSTMGQSSALQSSQLPGWSADTDVMLSRLKEIEDLIEVVACEIARQSKAKGR